MRKTISVADIKDRINSFLLNSPDSEKVSRESMIKILEEILMDTDNYHGFQYLSKIDMNKSDSGISVGINLIESTNFEKQFIDTDHTRVRYL
jgi:hypothetical protein